MKHLIVALLVVFTMAQVQAGGLGLGGKVSNVGLGLELTVGLTDNINTRFNINGYKYNEDYTEDGISYDADIKLSMLGALVDWHPFSNGFRLSGGLYLNGNKVTGHAQGAGLVQIGDTTYNLNEVYLDADIDLGNTVAPYLGIGFGNAVNPNRRWNFAADLGVAFTGKPKVDLTGGVVPGSLININDFQDDIQREEDNLEKDLEDYNILPMISVGVSYRF